MAQEINFTNPQDPKTKQFLQELNVVIAQEVISLTEMHKNLYAISLSKQQEEKEEEYRLIIQKVEQDEERKKQNDKIYELIASASSEKNNANEESLLKSKGELENLSKDLILKIHHLENYIDDCDKDIAKSHTEIEKYSNNISLLEARIVEELLKIAQEKGIFSSKGEAQKIDQIPTIETHQLKSASDYYSWSRSPEISIEAEAAKLRSYREEAIFMQVSSKLMAQLHPETAITAEDIMNFRRANPELEKDYKQIIQTNESSINNEMSGFLGAIQNVDNKNKEKIIYQTELQTTQTQLNETEKKLSEVESNLEKLTASTTKKFTPDSSSTGG